MSKLNEKAMLVNLSISQWKAQMLDKRATRETTDRHGADKDMGRFTKYLIDREELEDISRVATEARTYHYFVTMPWGDKGVRILPAVLWSEYAAKMQEFKGRFQASVMTFLEHFQEVHGRSMAKLNGLYDPSNYPLSWQLTKKYSFDVSFMPFPDREDFRVDMAAEEAEEVKANIEANVKTAIMEGTGELYSRLHKVVSAMVERLGDPDSGFRQSLVGNIAKLCAVLPKLNINNDPRLEELRREIEDKLTKNDADMLKENDQIRKDTANKAEEILRKIQEVMS